MLQKRRNKIQIFIYTNDDKGSYDLDMTVTSETGWHVDEEEEDSCKVLGIPAANIHWRYEFHDGMLGTRTRAI